MKPVIPRRLRSALNRVLGPSADTLLLLAESAARAGNHEEAYRYYIRVLESEPKNYNAWLGKAIAAGRLSALEKVRYDEMRDAITRAVEFAPASATGAMARSGAQAVISFAQVLPVQQQLLREELRRKPSDGTLVDLLYLNPKRDLATEALHLAIKLAPSDGELLRLVVDLCDERLSQELLRQVFATGDETNDLPLTNCRNDGFRNRRKRRC